ncbi:S41 family peptidase [Tellurirhabdus bombi]|uniref:S41 family peptidase n=1 Tax=Tellurirhabdus bombi TaxID=2907205 RepID=UPI001F2805DA|nr:S41 family peptidase [Tellurirhabdus bombi]
MKKIKILLVSLLGLGACQSMEPVKPSTDVITNFEYVWNEFDQMYGSFSVKKLDWNAAYQQYRPQLTAQSTNEDLYRILKQLIDPLKDAHVSIIPTDPNYKRYTSGEDAYPILNRTSLEVLQKNYLTDAKIATPEISYGKLPNNVGYLYITGFEDNFKNYEPTLDIVLDYLKDTKALVLDIRDHWGGRDEIGQYVAGRFADKTYLYLKSRKRSGPKHTDFTPWQEWYLKPTGKSQYTKPIILLTSDNTASAAETFTMAMKRLPYLKQVGLTTPGAISDKATREMPNGWQFTLSIGEYLDHNGLSWEGKGLAPDVSIANTDEDLMKGKDPQLDKALQLLP